MMRRYEERKYEKETVNCFNENYFSFDRKEN